MCCGTLFQKGVSRFLKKNERSVVWAAFCECTFEVGEPSELGALEDTTTPCAPSKLQQPSPYTPLPPARTRAFNKKGDARVTFLSIYLKTNSTVPLRVCYSRVHYCQSSAARHPPSCSLSLRWCRHSRHCPLPLLPQALE